MSSVGLDFEYKVIWSTDQYLCRGLENDLCHPGIWGAVWRRPQQCLSPHLKPKGNWKSMNVNIDYKHDSVFSWLECWSWRWSQHCSANISRFRHSVIYSDFMNSSQRITIFYLQKSHARKCGWSGYISIGNCTHACVERKIRVIYILLSTHAIVTLLINSTHLFYFLS